MAIPALYSGIETAQLLVPAIGGGDIFASSADYDAVAALAFDEINSALRNGTAVPVDDGNTIPDLQRAEAMLALHLRTQGLYQTTDADTGAGPLGARRWRREAYEILNRHTFPASADVPAAGAANVGAGTLTVSVFDRWTFDSRWYLRCITAGGADDAVFEVISTRLEGSHTWALADGVFPSESVRLSGHPQRLANVIRLEMSAITTEFALRDVYQFRTYAEFRRGRRRAPSGIAGSRVS